MFTKILNVFTTILLVVLVCLVIFVFISRTNGKSPSIFGYHIFQVSSGSMEPELHVGDVILDKEVDPSEIHVGDIITYNGISGDLKDKIITHKVINVYQSNDGIYKFITKGTLEGAVEDPEITQHQVIAKYLRKIPFLNKLYSFFLSEYGLITFVAAIVILFAYEMISLILSYKSIDEEYDEEYYEPKVKKKSKKRK